MAYCYRNSFGRRVCRSAWGGWGRWVLLGCLIGAVILFAFIFACISARRRRKLGHKPFYGTGWAAPGTVSYNPNGYGGNNNNNKPQSGWYGTNNSNAAPPPGYYAPPQGMPPQQNSGANADYYRSGGQTEQYQAPSYPPPAANRDGVIR